MNGPNIIPNINSTNIQTVTIGTLNTALTAIGVRIANATAAGADLTQLTAFKNMIQAELTRRGA